jgi:DNA-binding winged helix-turn-helix (wHTH) protein
MSVSTSFAQAIIEFPPFQLDLRSGQLRRDATPVPLRPKTFGVLQSLAERPGELLTKRALLDAVWGNVVVSEDVVRLSVGELRKALGDERALPRFIQTVPRRGYRFIAKMAAAAVDGRLGTAGPAIDDSSAADGVVVGRARERTEIAEWLRAATSGRRQIGFVTGESGIGKSTLVDTVLRDLGRAFGEKPRIARGQCVEHYGAGEPYLPVLDALASLYRGPDGPVVEMSLRDHAPDWLLDAIGLPAARRVDGAEPATHEHTLHKLVATFDALAADTPLVLVLEDVQWSDYSTLDLLSVMAHRRERARLLVLCTLRPADAIVRGHPVASVKRELLRKGLCREILLGGLSAVDVASYLAARFPGADLPEDLLPLLVDRSEGSPFFMVALVDHLLEQQLLVGGENRWELRGGFEALRTTISDDLRAVIEPRLERLALDELRVLEAASVAGLEFAAHALARVAPQGNDLDRAEYVEQLCDTLARRQEMLCATGESAWPDGTASARYAFRHALYQQVIYQGLSSSTRRRLHQMIGETLEAAHTGRTGEVASALAAHFERSRDLERAGRYHGEAAAHARSRFAYREARLHLETALGLLRSQPETAERLRQEIPLLRNLGSALFALKGYGDEGAARAFARMRELAERLDIAPMRLRAMDGLLLVHTMRAESTAARTLGEEIIVLAEQVGDGVAAASARLTLAATLMNLGEIEAARCHARQVRALSTESPPVPSAFGVSSCCLLASACAHLGLAARARAMTREARTRAVKLGIPYFRAHATNFAAQVRTVLRDVTGARLLAEEAVQLADQYGFAVFRITATMVRGWCDVEDGRVADGLATLRGAFDEYAATGQRVSTTFFSSLLAEVHLANGDATRANEMVSRALAFAAETGERIYESELYRLRGECLLSDTATDRRKVNATQCFKRALAIAADQKAVLFELRAATSLCRLRPHAARERLVRLVDCFHADDDCADLRAARALLSIGQQQSN